VTLGAVTAAVLYVNQLIDPVDRLISWMDELQVGGASLARLLGITDVPDDREPSGRTPQDEVVEARDVRFSYVDGRDVLHGVDLVVHRASGSPWWGRPEPASPPSAGSSRASIRRGPVRSPWAASG
jgi:ABC-type multidrug transport system fused ATPase/permease subunit